MGSLQKSIAEISIAPLNGYIGTPRFEGWAKVLVVAAVVTIVSVADAALAPVMLTGLVLPKLKIGRSTALVGLEVIAAVSATLPVNPPNGVMMIAEKFPVLAPGAIVTVDPSMLKPALMVYEAELTALFE